MRKPAPVKVKNKGGSGQAEGFAQALPMADGRSHRQAPKRVPKRDISRLGAQTLLAAATLSTSRLQGQPVQYLYRGGQDDYGRQDLL